VDKFSRVVDGVHKEFVSKKLFENQDPVCQKSVSSVDGATHNQTADVERNGGS
jgi:hypothetical protein